MFPFDDVIMTIVYLTFECNGNFTYYFSPWPTDIISRVKCKLILWSCCWNREQNEISVEYELRWNGVSGMDLAAQFCFYWRSCDLYTWQTTSYVKILGLIIVDNGLSWLLMLKPRPTVNYITVYHSLSSNNLLWWKWESLCMARTHSYMSRFHCIDMPSWKVNFLWNG